VSILPGLVHVEGIVDEGHDLLAGAAGPFLEALVDERLRGLQPLVEDELVADGALDLVAAVEAHEREVALFAADPRAVFLGAELGEGLDVVVRAVAEMAQRDVERLGGGDELGHERVARLVDLLDLGDGDEAPLGVGPVALGDGAGVCRGGHGCIQSLVTGWFLSSGNAAMKASRISVMSDAQRMCRSLPGVYAARVAGSRDCMQTL
jgi:hypothetical protein